MRNIWIDDAGATAIEYGLIAALVAVASLPGLVAMSESHSGPKSVMDCADKLFKNVARTGGKLAFKNDGKGACGNFENPN